MTPHHAFSGPNADRLNAMFARYQGKPSAAAFDFDHTCVWGDIGLTTSQFVDRRDGTHILTTYAEQKAAGDHHGACITVAKELLRGRTPDEAGQLGVEAFAAGEAAGCLEEEPAMVALIRRMIAENWKVYLVTASPGPIVADLAARWGVDKANVIGFDATRDAQGRFTDHLIAPFPHGAGKAEALEPRLEAPLRFAAGDALQDVPMLELAEHVMVVDRGNETLRQMAADRDYWIQGDWGPSRKPTL